jgi:hypothetical protein
MQLVVLPCFKDKYQLMLNIMFCMPVMLICIMYSVVHMNYCYFH